MQKKRDPRALPLWLVIALFIGFIGCSKSPSSGCSCAKPLPGGFPEQYKIDNIAQIKITRKGFDFLEQNHQILIRQFMPNGLTFQVPYSKQKNFEVCINQNKSECKVTLKIRKLKFDLIPKKTIRTRLWLDATSGKIKIRGKFGFLKATCDLIIKAYNKPLLVDLLLGVDPRTKDLTFQVSNPQLKLSDSDFKLKGGFACSLADALKSLFMGTINKEVKKAIDKNLKDLNCMRCTTNADCGGGGAVCKSKKCYRGNACVPTKMGMDGVIQLSSVMGNFANPTSNDLLFGTYAGGRAEVKTSGVEVGMRGGTHSERHPCVAPRKFPKLPTPAPFPFPATATNGLPYMLGFGLSQTMLTKFSQDLYNSGALCIKIDENFAAQFKNLFKAKGIGALIAPSINKIVGKENPPLYIALRPSVPPEINIGKGEVIDLPGGKKKIKEPLIELLIPKLNFDFMLLLYDRWIRLFTFQVDVAIELAVTVKPGNKLGIVMGDLNSALKNPRIINSNILKEDPNKMAKALYNMIKTIIPMATGKLGNQEFKIPEFQGVKVVVRDITGQIPRKDKPNRYQYLAVFADLAAAPPTKPQLPEPEPIELEILSFRTVPHLWEKFHQTELREFPKLELWIKNYRRELEYSVRINGGPWHPYVSSPKLTVESPQFIFPGTHTVEVISREAERPYSSLVNYGSITFTIPRK